MSGEQTYSDELRCLLALCKIEGIGPTSARKLLRYFGSASAIFGAKPTALMQINGLNVTRVKAIAAFKDFEPMDKELRWCERHGVKLLSILDADYPNRLKHCDDAPVLLFKKGPANLSAERMVSIVGTRRVTDYGKQMTREIVAHLQPYGVTVVSGLAYGVDVEAHKTALEMGLPTVAVLAHGLNRIYPSSHTRYANEMEAKGALLTEHTTDAQPDRENFPMRNRIVAGMCDATIVVESGAKGGSMITADLANGYSRDVFAVPGRIGDDRSAGCNKLIKSQRAHLIESVKDLGYIMGWELPEKKHAVQRKIFVDLSPAEEALVNCLRESGQLQIDDICLKAGMATSTVMVHLLNLELNGMVRSLPGKMYTLC
jgi:DNA processing protein